MSTCSLRRDFVGRREVIRQLLGRIRRYPCHGARIHQLAIGQQLEREDVDLLFRLLARADDVAEVVMRERRLDAVATHCSRATAKWCPSARWTCGCVKRAPTSASSCTRFDSPRRRVITAPAERCVSALSLLHHQPAAGRSISALPTHRAGGPDIGGGADCGQSVGAAHRVPRAPRPRADRADRHPDDRAQLRSAGLAYGVGPDTAAQLLITAGTNAHRLRSEAAFVLAGAAPIPASSGKPPATGFPAAETEPPTTPCTASLLVRWSHDPRTRDYVTRQPAAGRSKRHPAPTSNERSPARCLHTSPNRA